jgi:hypothetical protein
MLNQTLPSAPRPAGNNVTPISPDIAPDLANTDWCVGDAPTRWDVSFTDRLVVSVRRIFSRGQPPPAVQRRKAA